MKHLRIISIVLAGTIFCFSPVFAQNGVESAKNGIEYNSNASAHDGIVSTTAALNNTSAISCNASDQNDCKIPDDPDLIIGHLDNGMTYYIRHNANPAGCADFYIVHNVGALQEEDNQNGLAHFLEHMAFNGTKHFPDKKLLEFLEKDGVRFGYDVNAYTSRTETVYNISSVPLVRESFVDSVLLVLHDWSCDISCEQKDLDDERGVISEEWRRRDDQRTRMAMKQSNLLYNGSKHCDRNVIGTLEIINGFSRNEILDFYHKWYRPDLQAIMIVGDFDAEEMEQKVRAKLSDIPAAINPAQKEVYDIPALNGPLFENMTDPEVSIFTLKMMIRQDVPCREVRGTEGFYRDNFTKLIVEHLIYDRLKEAGKGKDSPVKSSVFSCNAYGTDFYNNLFTMIPKDKHRLKDCLVFLERELKRCKDFGFTDEELENARFKTLQDLRLDRVKTVESTTSEELEKIYVNSWLRGFPNTDPVTLDDIRRSILSGITAEEVNSAMLDLLTSNERIYSYVINEKETGLLPSKEEMQEIIDEVSKETLEPRYLKFKKIDLSIDTAQGKIVKTSQMKGSDTEVWTLSNGAKVWFTPCAPVKANTHLSVCVNFKTGLSSTGAAPSAERFANTYIARYAGFRGLDAVQVKNRQECSGVSYLISKNSSARSVIQLSSDGQNAEKAFAVLHLLVTEPYLGSENTFDKYQHNTLSSLKKKKTESALFEQDCRDIIYSGNPYRTSVDTAVVAATSLEDVQHIFDRHFTKFDDMEVFIATDLDKEDVKDYVCRYIASLTGDYAKEGKKVKPISPDYRGKNELVRTVDTKSSPKTQIQSRYRYTLKNSPKENVTLDILDYILSDRYLNQIREKRGGTYHIGFSSERSGKALATVESFVDFQTRPEMKDILLEDVDAVLDEMCKNGPTRAEMDAAVSYLIKADAKKKEKDSNSVSAQNHKVYLLVEFGQKEADDYVKLIKSITTEGVRKLAVKIAVGDRFTGVYTEE